jgi:hypothetical protein
MTEPLTMSEAMSGATSWREPLDQVFAAIRIDAPHELTFAGRKFTAGIPAGAGAAAVPGADGTANAKVPLVELLTGVLYRYVYSRPFKPPLPPQVEEREDFTLDEGLSGVLSAANASRDRWEHGWTIEQIHSSGQITAQRGNLSRSLWPGQFLSKDGPGARPRKGAQVSIFYPRESTSLQPGFYYCFGETPEDEAFTLGLVRIYWNIGLAGAPELVRSLSTRLNFFQVPFRFKCSVMPSQYDRTDVAVVYLAKRLFPFVADLLQEVYPAVRPHLEPEVPFLTWRLAPGVGVAEDPGNGESFGQHRCRLLAESCWNCFLRGDQEAAARLEELRLLAGAQGADPERFHLNAGSLDCYEAPVAGEGSGS